MIKLFIFDFILIVLALFGIWLIKKFVKNPKEVMIKPEAMQML